MWPFKKKKKELTVTVLRIKETLSATTVSEMDTVLTEFGIHFYALRGTGMLPGTTLIYSERALTDSELNATEEKLIKLELTAIEPQYKA